MKIETRGELLLFTTFRIETKLKNGKYGFGTGFFFRCQCFGQPRLFLVTNKHVVLGAVEGTYVFTEHDGTKPLIGKAVNVQVADFGRRWHGHPDPRVDVTVQPFIEAVEPSLVNAGKRVFVPELTLLDFVPTPDQVENVLNTIEEIIFIGYPNAIFDKVNLLPVVRRGITATPFAVDHDGLPTFLIDASVFPGSSGSPVFIYNTFGYTDRRMNVFAGGPGQRLLFLGVLAACSRQYEDATVEPKEVPETLDLDEPELVAKVEQLVDIGTVFKPKTIIEAIEYYLTQTR